MINKLLQIVAPHHCYVCHKTGSLLCSNCKYNISDEAFDACLVCARPSANGVCARCQTTYQKAWYVGDRSGALEGLVNALKFERVKDAATVLGDLLDERLPLLPQHVIVVPVPTVSRHIRQRGYDHALLIARRLAKQRGLAVQTPLIRQTNNQQRGLNKTERFRQAENAFACTEQLDASIPYLLIDDVVTTNATLRYAAKSLREAGAKVVWVAVVARQPLDKLA